jgi:mannose-6-phosphate isomerase-like protein (cupin superfamily)
VPIRHKVAEGAATFQADWSFDLAEGPGWTMHAHVIPEGQLVPLHHHPVGEELVWIAGGTASWQSLARGEAHMAHLFTDLAPFGLAWTPPGVAHAVRSRQAPPLVAVVLSRPAFGQNWYLLPDEVTSLGRSALVANGEPLPPGLLPGWATSWLGADDVGTPRAASADTLYLVGDAVGRLRFEDRDLPVEPALFVRIPPGLTHTLAVPAEQAGRVLRIEVPPSPS